jgi:hypothetical protein
MVEILPRLQEKVIVPCTDNYWIELLCFLEFCKGFDKNYPLKLTEMKRFIPITVLFGLFLLPSCKDKDCYQVNGILDPYLQLFLKEAEKRNLHFDVEEDGLILEFADLDEPTIGLCTYSDPLLVQIDQEYWRNVEEYENCEDLRENVVFHELAHGLLNRRHDNEVMANKEWASLMCGGDEVEGRSWQVNFSGERRDYYLDELFNPATPHPKWGEYGERFSGEKGAKINELNLSSDKYEVDGDGNIFQIKDGVYHISLNSPSNTLLPIWKNLNLSGDFYYEIALKGDLSDDKKCMGVGVGLKNETMFLIPHSLSIITAPTRASVRLRQMIAASLLWRRCYSKRRWLILMISTFSPLKGKRTESVFISTNNLFMFLIEMLIRCFQTYPSSYRENRKPLSSWRACTDNLLL